MEKITYRSRFFVIVIFLYIIAAIILYDFLSSSESSDVGEISKNNFKNKAIFQENLMLDFLNPYISTIKAVEGNQNFKRYLSKELDKNTIENYFLSIKKSLPCLLKIRYIDASGKEIIKSKENSILFYEDNINSEIVSSNKLENKKLTDHTNTFFNFEKNKIGFSKIALSMENEKNLLSKEPNLRIGIKVYDVKNDYKGILIFYISLKTFFNKINNLILYNVDLIDEKGNFIFHHTGNHELLGKSTYTLKDQFPKKWENILANDEYFGEDFFSYKFKQINNEQNIKVILKLKFNEEIKERMDNEQTLVFYFFLFMIFSFIIIIYFSRLPDSLKKEISKSRIINTLTKLPNRLALLDDLRKNRFDESLVILISINNLNRIHNTYGQKISDNLLQKIAHYLSKYEDKNIEKIYFNSFNIFSLKYKFETNRILKAFLTKLIYDLENNILKIDKNDLEFSLDITIGVSNPNKLNAKIEKLKEAENALENALNNHLDMDIYNISHSENIDLQKENITLAKDVKKAIEEHSLILYYQPILNNNTNKIEKYECLIRMKTKEELVYPDKFLPISKQIRKYNQLSKEVVDKAISFFKNNEYEFSINISIVDIMNQEFREYLIKKVSEHNVGSRLVLEIVEQEGVENYTEFYNFVKEVKALGCKIAIDDFGSGYSNYEYIIKMGDYIDYIKLDGSLIREILTEEKVIFLIQSIIFLCDKLRIKTIAEYVDNKEVQNYLRLLGIDFSQGYYIGKPKDRLV